MAGGGIKSGITYVSKFLADDSPEAYGRLVDSLISNPRYGEHQARYWLDAVRYGDTHGSDGTEKAIVAEIGRAHV